MKRSNKRIESVESKIASISQSPPKKKEPNKLRKEKLDGFEKIEKDEEVYLFQSDMKTEFDFPNRNPTLLNLLFYYFDDTFLDSYISTNLKYTNDLPPIFLNINESTRRRDLNLESRKLLLKYIATRLFIMSDPKKILQDNWPLKDDSKKLYLGRDNFKLMLSNMLIRLPMIKLLNERFGRYIKSGRHVVIDEKHKGTNRDQHLSRWVHGKDPNWGHWITEVTTIVPLTGMPLLIKALPLSSLEPRNVTEEPYNNLSLVDIHKEIVSCLRENTIIVEDAYYLDDQSRTYLRNNNIKYISSINSVRFSELWTDCSKYVEKKGDWVILENEDTEEHCMMRWDPMGETIYSN